MWTQFLISLIGYGFIWAPLFTVYRPKEEITPLSWRFWVTIASYCIGMMIIQYSHHG